MKEPSYFDELINIRVFLEENVEKFPNNSCCLASNFLKDILGLGMTAGYYTPMRDWHAWCYDLKNKIYVDLTLDQFSRKYDKIEILPLTSNLLKINSTIHNDNKRASEGKYFKTMYNSLLFKYKSF